jgi:hypothetical protein
MLKVLIVSVILVVFAMLGLAVKLLFDKDAEFILHSCAGENKDLNDIDSCTVCEIKESVDFYEN